MAQTMVKNADVNFEAMMLASEPAIKVSAQFNMPDNEMLATNKYWKTQERNGIIVNYSAIMLPDFSWSLTAVIQNTWHQTVYGKDQTSTVKLAVDTFDTQITIEKQVMESKLEKFVEFRRLVCVDVQHAQYVASGLKGELKFPHIELSPEQIGKRKPLVLPVGNQSVIVGKISGQWKRPPQLRG